MFVIKLGMPMPWETYERQDRVVRAMRMEEDFLLETSHGFVKGRKGDWVVLVGNNILFPVTHEWFQEVYTLCQHPKKATH